MSCSRSVRQREGYGNDDQWTGAPFRLSLRPKRSAPAGTDVARQALTQGTADQPNLALPVWPSTARFHLTYKIALIGFLGSDAEARTTKNGASYTVLSLATKRSCHACDLAGEGNHRPGPIRVPHYWPYLVSTRSPRGETRDLRCHPEEGRARSTGRGTPHAGLRQGVRQHPCHHSERSEESPVKQRVCEVALDSILRLDRAERQEEPIEPAADPA
jgi:hypothetical protein